MTKHHFSIYLGLNPTIFRYKHKALESERKSLEVDTRVLTDRHSYWNNVGAYGIKFGAVSVLVRWGKMGTAYYGSEVR